MKFHHSLVAAAAAVALPAFASGPVPVTSTLTFDGVSSFEAVADTYAPLGIAFSAEGLALSNDGTGSGVNGEFFTHAPSMGAVLFAPGSNESVTISALAGKAFVQSVSVYYSSAYVNSALVDLGYPAFAGILNSAISVYDAAGQRIISNSLDQNASVGCSDSPFCNWNRVTVSFSGEAKTIVLKGANGSIAYDNLTVSTVPEPQSYALMLAGLAAVGFLAARRRA